jgi:ribosomal-protein-alanine N-acetyltransferase
VKLVIRELGERDLDTVAAIEAAGSPQPWSRQLFAGELDLDPASRHWLVACSDGAVVGFGGVMYALDTAHLMNLGVAASHAKRGVGYRLCLALLADAGRRQITGMTLEVRVSNLAAIALYRKLGMTPVGVRSGYYPDGEDAEIFWLRDLQAPTRQAPTRQAQP